MSSPARDSGFFVGYFSKVPRALAVFSLGVGAAIVGAAAGASLLLSSATDDPVARLYLPDSIAAGVYEPLPYPHVRQAPDATHPMGHTVLLAGDGKHGAQAAGAGFSGRAVEVKGGLLKRGTIDMLIVETMAAAGAPATGGAAPSKGVSPAVALGRWRIGGEVCDGKCAAGAMSPGRGLAHKSCASLCIAGGLPPILVSEQAVAGAQFMLLANRDGGPLAPGSFERLLARPAVLEGDLERRGDLLVFKTDPATATFP